MGKADQDRLLAESAAQQAAENKIDDEGEAGESNDHVHPPPISVADLQAQVNNLSAQIVSLPAMITAAISAQLAAAVAPPHPAQPVSLSSAPPRVVVLQSAPASAPTHHQRVLGVSSTETESINRLIEDAQQQRVSLDDEESEVDYNDTHTAQQSTTSQMRRSTPLSSSMFPASLAPTALGAQPDDPAHQLARLLTTFNKSSSMKYATLNDLSLAIDEWATISIKAGWSGEQIGTIFRYKTFLIDQIGRNNSVKEAAQYHSLWSKAVDAGTINLFSPGSEYHALSYIAVFPASSHTTGYTAKATHKNTISKKRKTPDAASPKKKTFAAGSCIKHPTSTSHDTSMCNKK